MTIIQLLSYILFIRLKWYSNEYNFQLDFTFRNNITIFVSKQLSIYDYEDLYL